MDSGGSFNGAAAVAAAVANGAAASFNTHTVSTAADMAAGPPCLPTPVSIAIVTPFRSSYVRNNKGAVQKNVRCFPQCHFSGHRTNSFCGSPVQVCACVCARAWRGGEACVRMLVKGQVGQDGGHWEVTTPHRLVRHAGCTRNGMAWWRFTHVPMTSWE